MSEPKVPKGSLPTGYSFVPKGNVYITSNCRKMTQESGRSVYLVIDEKQQQIGIGVPLEVHVCVQFKERSTRAERAANVVKRDEGMAKGFQKEIMNIFPQIPPYALQNVAQVALQKGKGKVGRVGKLDVQRKARLAVWAHVRHRETDYDALLRRGVPREEARQQVEAKIKEVYKAWGVGSQTKHGKTRKTSKSSARPKIKPPQARKVARRASLLQSKKNAKNSISTTAITRTASPRASKKAGQFTSERNTAVRNAKRAHRQTSLEDWLLFRNKPKKAEPRTSSPNVIATAASFREKRTPKPRDIEPITPSAPKAKTRLANPTMPNLDHENRAHLLRLVARIDTIERAHRIACKKERKRHMTRLRTIESLNNRINGILEDASVQTIESSAADRQDLVKRLRRKVRTPEEGLS